MRSGLGAGCLGTGKGIGGGGQGGLSSDGRLSAGNGFIWELRQDVGGTECFEP